MEYLRQTINSEELNGVFVLPQSLLNRKVDVIILPVEDNAFIEPKEKRQLGFLKGVVPPLPDSFFDSLPEEDLQAWGL